MPGPESAAESSGLVACTDSSSVRNSAGLLSAFRGASRHPSSFPPMPDLGAVQAFVPRHEADDFLRAWGHKLHSLAAAARTVLRLKGDRSHGAHHCVHARRLGPKDRVRGLRSETRGGVVWYGTERSFQYPSTSATVFYRTDSGIPCRGRS